jgi:hypothetical protein
MTAQLAGPLTIKQIDEAFGTYTDRFARVLRDHDRVAN